MWLISEFDCLCNQEKEKKYQLSLENLKVRDVEAGRFSIGKKFVFAIYYTSGR